MAGVLSLACFCFLSGNPALAQQPAPQKAAGGILTIDPAELQKPWTGDLNGMIQRRVIRVLTVNSKTIYFVDKGVLMHGGSFLAGCSKSNQGMQGCYRRRKAAVQISGGDHDGRMISSAGSTVG